jgi:hypothetical protein
VWVTEKVSLNKVQIILNKHAAIFWRETFRAHYCKKSQFSTMKQVNNGFIVWSILCRLHEFPRAESRTVPQEVKCLPSRAWLTWLLHCALRVLHNLWRCGAGPGQPPPPPCPVPGHSDTSMSPLSVRCCSFVEYVLSCSFTFTLVLVTDRDYGRKNLCK